MKMTIESTTEIVELNDGSRARVWRGHGEAGTPVIAYVAAVQLPGDAPEPDLLERQPALPIETAARAMGTSMPLSDGDIAACRERLTELGVDAAWATQQSLMIGRQCYQQKINAQTVMLLGLVIADGVRVELSAEVADAIKAIHRVIDAESDRRMVRSKS